MRDTEYHAVSLLYTFPYNLLPLWDYAAVPRSPHSLKAEWSQTVDWSACHFSLQKAEAVSYYSLQGFPSTLSLYLQRSLEEQTGESTGLAAFGTKEAEPAAFELKGT